MYIFAPQAFV